VHKYRTTFAKNFGEAYTLKCTNTVTVNENMSLWIAVYNSNTIMFNFRTVYKIGIFKGLGRIKSVAYSEYI